MFTFYRPPPFNHWVKKVQTASATGALLASLIAAPFLIVQAARVGDVGNGGVRRCLPPSMVLWHVHALLRAAFSARTKQVFQVLDHSAIYLLIAGTYTPFTLGVRGPWLDAVWPGGQAAGGCAGQIVCRDPLAGCPPSCTWRWAGRGGAIQPMWQLMALELFWLVAGGLAYTFGVIFSCWTAPARYGHFIWHFRGDGDACTRWRCFLHLTM
jgi:hemolysin III